MNAKSFEGLGISPFQWDESFQWDEEQEIPKIPWLQENESDDLLMQRERSCPVLFIHWRIIQLMC